VPLFSFPAGRINPLNAELNPICHLLELLGAHHILHVGRIKVKDENCFNALLLGLNKDVILLREIKVRNLN